MNHSLAFIDIPDVRQILGGGLLMSLNVMDQMIFIHRIKSNTALEDLKCGDKYNLKYVFHNQGRVCFQSSSSEVKDKDDRFSQKEPTPNKRENL